MHRLCIGSTNPRTESSKNLDEKKAPETMSSLTSSTPEVTMKTGSTKEKPRRTQAEVGITEEIPSPFTSTPFSSSDKSHVNYNKYAQIHGCKRCKDSQERRYLTQRYETSLQ